MTDTQIKDIIEKQREFFATGATYNVDYRIRSLKKLKKYINEHIDELNEALKDDLGKSHFEGYMCETGLALSEITYMIKNTCRFASDKHVLTALVQFASDSVIKTVPYGNVLIMSPWNYPFLLSITPLVDAIAAGNTCILKPSAYSPNTSEAIKKMIDAVFSPEHVCCITGGREENKNLLNNKFDYIFFTGSKNVGCEVLKSAAPNLTPVTLELGGKSPCIVDKDANIRLAARRIVFGKYLNCGQTCVAPDYIYVEESIKDEFVKAVKKEISRQYTDSALSNPDYGKIINEKHFDRLMKLIDTEKVVYGGYSERKRLKIEPTVMDNVTWDDAVMKEEIFGPIMPILTFSSLKPLISFLNTKPHPLAAFYFGKNRKAAKYFTQRLNCGGGCINDTVVHLATNNMGFGGVGESGMGAYHGKVGFDTFSHKKSILDKKQWIDLPMRYQPYTKLYGFLLRMFLK
ncbi:MAG: aldehyde dehydrogenase [Lachnospiraceae bacterium]|nr:aldehyde dehydrogenase [Lachnospiraceae bacterium]